MKRWIATPVFYLTAFLANALFLVLSLWLYLRVTEPPSEAGDDFYAIIELLPALLTVLPATLGTWILRRLMRRLPRSYIWQWAIAGAAIGWGLVWGLGWISARVESAHFSLAWQGVKSVLMFALLLGPMMLTFQPWWLPLPALALTGGLLFLVQRAFGWQTASKK